MSKLNTLFDFSKFEKRKTANQQAFEMANRQLLIDFKQFVNVSFKQLHQKVLTVIAPLDQDKNLKAVVMSGYLAGQLKRKYPLYCGLATPQRFKLWIDGVSVYIKKLDEKNKLPSNIPTDESLKIYNQLADDNEDKGCNIFLGYTVSDDWSRITGIYLVCIEGEERIWMTDLTNFGEDQASPVIPMTPKPIAPQIKVGAKRKKKIKIE